MRRNNYRLNFELKEPWYRENQLLKLWGKAETSDQEKLFINTFELISFYRDDSVVFWGFFQLLPWWNYSPNLCCFDQHRWAIVQQNQSERGDGVGINKPSRDRLRSTGCWYLVLNHEQVVTQVQFVRSGVQQVWIKNFPSPRLVAISKLKNLVYPTIYSELKREEMDSCFSQLH